MTLLEDLELARRFAVNSAEHERRVGQPALAEQDEAFAARLRAHAERLREYLRMAATPGANEVAVKAVLAINGGPVSK